MADMTGFFERKFMYNNLRILILSVFLVLEQIFYGLFVRQPGSLEQKIHFISAFIMLIYAIASIYIQIHKPTPKGWIYKLYEISFGFYGFMIAIIRSLLIQNTIFSLPTIYIAVIYGFAAIFYFHPRESFIIYSITSIILIVTLPTFQPIVLQSSYIQDVVANNIIAWFTSVLNYNKHYKEFINKRVITKNNEALKEKNFQIRMMNEKLKEISIRDGLTNIYNRRKIDDILIYEYNRAKQYSQDLSVIFVDVDFFKMVNDTYGHNVGDKVLLEIATILKDNIREIDLIGRWGGEEFLIVCPYTDIYAAKTISERLKTAVAKNHFSIVKQRTCSFGVAAYKKGDEVHDLIHRADVGLYQAKENGRNRVEAVS